MPSDADSGPTPVEWLEEFYDSVFKPDGRSAVSILQSLRRAADGDSYLMSLYREEVQQKVEERFPRVDGVNRRLVEILETSDTTVRNECTHLVDVVGTTCYCISVPTVPLASCDIEEVFTMEPGDDYNTYSTYTGIRKSYKDPVTGEPLSGNEWGRMHRRWGADLRDAALKRYREEREEDAY